MRFNLILIITTLLFSAQLYAQGVGSVGTLKRKNYDMPSSFETAEELLIIQAVSTTKRTFIVRKGRKHGVFPGQESLFSNETISLLARATEVTNDTSLWQVRDPNGQVPFLKNSYVTYAPTLEKIAVEIPNRAMARAEEEKTRRERKVTPNSIVARIGLSMAMYESVSETESERKPTRQGMSFDGVFGHRILPTVEIAIGARYDREVATIDDPKLDIPTTRIMAIAESTYFFEKQFRGPNTFYATIGAGIGRSTTEIDTATSAGMVTILPYVRLGQERPLGNRLKLLLEFMAESISMSERFTDSAEQTTNIVNAKFSIGLRY